MQLSIQPIRLDSRLPILDELKGIAIILVVLIHAWDISGIVNKIRGEAGVDLFLIISGFTLAISSASTPAQEFLKRRLFRIFPAYWIALALFTALGFVYAGGVSATDIVLHAFGVHAFASYEYFGSINPSFWFVSLILLMYLAFLGVRKRMHDIPFMLSVGLGATLALSILYAELGNTPVIQMLVPRVMSFFAGMVAGAFASAGRADIRGSVMWVLAAILAYFVFVRGTFFANMQVALVIIIAWAGMRKGLGRLRIGKGVMSVLSYAGLISYEVYLFHQPLMQYLAPYVMKAWLYIDVPSPQMKTLSIIISVIVTILMSIAVNRLTRMLWKPRARAVE